jgi:hypothetical protein
MSTSGEDRPLCIGREEVRHYLEVSTANLPERLSAHLDRCTGLLSWPHDLGAYLYVPADAQELSDTERDGCPPEILQLFRYAISLGCSLIDLRRDVAPVGGLPSYQGDFVAGPQPAPAAAASPQAAQAAHAAQVPMAGPPALPAPGWYRDPADPSRHRWWDGQGWTDHTS